MNTQAEETKQFEELGKRLSTQTANGASGAAAIAHHHEVAGEDDAKKEAEARDIDEADAGTAAPKVAKTSKGAVKEASLVSKEPAK